LTGDRDAAWDAVHEAYSVTARGPHPGRGKAPVTVSGTGEDETAALSDLDDRLRGVPKPDGTRLDELRRRLRHAYVDGAEEWTRANVGRQMTRDELGRVLERYVGR
jgi:hypothetical protein